MKPLMELDQDVVRRVDRSFLVDGLPIDVDDLVHDFSREVDLASVEVVVSEAMTRFTSDDRAQSDAWLGPRLHAALRLTRREAARRGIWRYLGVVAFPHYVRWRWPREKDDQPAPPALERFVGPDYKQALARLWWMAELFRNGDDYAPAVEALANQDITNNLFRMDVAHHRPTAVGAIAVLAAQGTSREPGASGREANALAKAINAAATTLAIDVLAPDEALDDAARMRWIGDAPNHDPVHHFDDALPPAPDDPPVPRGSLEAMARLLEQLLAEAPVRGRG
jgi:hypothetical protein